MENDNNFGYEKITILVDNIPLSFIDIYIYKVIHYLFLNIVLSLIPSYFIHCLQIMHCILYIKSQFCLLHNYVSICTIMFKHSNGISLKSTGKRMI